MVAFRLDLARTQPRRFDVLDHAEVSTVHELSKLDRCRRVAVGVVTHQDEPMLLGCRCQLLPLEDRARHRLLDEHVPTCLEASRRQLEVGLRWGRDGDAGLRDFDDRDYAGVYVLRRRES